MDLVRRIRWLNLARAAAVVAVIALVVAWPLRRSEPPALPTQPVLVDTPPPTVTEPLEDVVASPPPRDEPRTTKRSRERTARKAKRPRAERRERVAERPARQPEETPPDRAETPPGGAPQGRAAPPPAPPTPSQAQGEFGFE